MPLKIHMGIEDRVREYMEVTQAEFNNSGVFFPTCFVFGSYSPEEKKEAKEVSILTFPLNIQFEQIAELTKDRILAVRGIALFLLMPAMQITEEELEKLRDGALTKEDAVDAGKRSVIGMLQYSSGEQKTWCASIDNGGQMESWVELRPMEDRNPNHPMKFFEPTN